MSNYTKVTSINEFTLYLLHGKYWNYDSDRNEEGGDQSSRKNHQELLRKVDQ